MESMLPNAGDEEAKMDWSEHGQKDKGLTKKQRILIVLGGFSALLLVIGLLFLSRGGKQEKQSKTIAPVNRGLMQAETIRTQKDMLDGKLGRRNDEDWEAKFQALREGRSKMPLFDSMPDPVPMFKNPPGEEASDPGDPRGTRPGSSPSVFGNIAKSFPTMQKHQTSSTMAGGAEEEAAAFKPSERMAKEMSDEYQKALAFNASEQLVFTRTTRTEEGGKGHASQAMPVSPKTGSSKVIVSAGDEMVAVLTESLNSDYPSVAKATLTSPAELAGSTLLLSYALGQERMSAQVIKLILPAKEGERAREQPLTAVVKSGLPGLSGDVSHHWIPQIASGIANAGLTAGALYYASQNSNKDLGTAVLVAPMVEQSVQGILKPVNYLGRDRPVTVKVPAGTEFKLLVTEGFEVEL